MPLIHRRVEAQGRSRRPLAVGFAFARTFGSIVAFLAVLLLVAGVYALVEVIAHPLEGQSSEIIGGAVLITLAAVMMFYLIEPRVSARFRRRQAMKTRSSRSAILHLPLFPRQRKTASDSAPNYGTAAKPAYEFTLTLSESPRDSVPQEDDGDAVHDPR
jgi:hypothetical protein